MKAYIFDCIKLDLKFVCSKILSPLCANPNIIKLFHDLHSDVATFSKLGDITEFKSLLDTQLLMEYKSGNYLVGFEDMIMNLSKNKVVHPLKSKMNHLFAKESSMFK